LLDAVGDVPHRRHDASVLGDVVKQFEMMDIHDIDWGDARELLSIHAPEASRAITGT
jgi:hypothetical protein